MQADRQRCTGANIAHAGGPDIVQQVVGVVVIEQAADPVQLRGGWFGTELQFLAECAVFAQQVGFDRGAASDGQTDRAAQRGIGGRSVVLIATNAEQVGEPKVVFNLERAVELVADDARVAPRGDIVFAQVLGAVGGDGTRHDAAGDTVVGVQVSC